MTGLNFKKLSLKLATYMEPSVLQVVNAVNSKIMLVCRHISSYRQASRQLNAESKSHRSINNDDRIRRNISDIAKMIEEEKIAPFKAVPKNEAAKQLVTSVSQKGEFIMHLW